MVRMVCVVAQIMPGRGPLPRRGMQKVPWRMVCFVDVVISQREFTLLPARCDVLDALVRVDRELGSATTIITPHAVIAATADRLLAMADRLLDGRRNSSLAPSAELEC